MVAPSEEALITEPVSPNIGLCKYARRNLLAKTGVVKGNPFKYEVTQYLYATSGISLPATGYNVRPARSDAVLQDSNWIGYVAVATDEGKVALGRRDILVVWRGTMRPLEWISNFQFLFVKTPLIFGEESDPLVHKGWYDTYTTVNQDEVLKWKSARDMVREEVTRLVDLYKDDEISITVTGHSLGSSLATLNATDLAVNPIKDDILVTAFLGIIIESKDADIFPLIPYKDAGVGFIIESKKSYHLKPDIKGLLGYHDLMFYLHGIDGFQGSDGGFEPHGDFDIAKLNKYQDGLKDEYYVPVKWLVVKNKAMVQQDDGTYHLDDHEVDGPF